MPITPLHFGVLAPINHFTKYRISVWSFGLVNLWIDLPIILAVMSGEAFPPREDTHSMIIILIIGTLVAMPGVRSARWVIGAYYGALTHWLLDSLVHSDMQPFSWMEGNPLYMGWMEPLSWALMPLTAWALIQCMSNAQESLRKKQEAFLAWRNRRDS